MSRLWYIPIALFVLTFPLSASNSHLLIYSQGDGAVASFEGKKNHTLSKATFLPKDVLISVRPRSGIETISAGFQFRFGSESKITIEDEAIELHAGSLFLRSRKISNQILVKGPDASINLEGSGICLLNVEPNGGFKIIGVLGKIHLEISSSKSHQILLPGDLLFVLPQDGGLGDKLNIKLETLIESSYLLSGFPNSVSLSKSLYGMALAQKQMISTSYNAHVGEAKSDKSYEIIPSKPLSSASSSDSDFSSDPLSELLESRAKRLGQSSNVQVPDSSPSPIPQKRPFPSRLLRSTE